MNIKKNTVPVILCTIFLRTEVRWRCTHCLQYHYAPIHSINKHISGICTKKDSPYEETGFILKLDTEYTDEAYDHVRSKEK